MDHHRRTPRRGLAVRISVCNWTTDDEDVRRTIDALARAHRE